MCFVAACLNLPDRAILLEWLRRKTGALQKHLQVPPRSAAPSHG